LNDNLPVDVRCPRCSRLLGKRQSDGRLEIVEPDRRVVLLERGEVQCLRCGERTKHSSVLVAAGPAA
jgi:hypothetical protein